MCYAQCGHKLTDSRTAAVSFQRAKELWAVRPQSNFESEQFSRRKETLQSASKNFDVKASYGHGHRFSQGLKAEA